MLIGKSLRIPINVGEEQLAAQRISCIRNWIHLTKRMANSIKHYYPITQTVVVQGGHTSFTI